MSLTGQANLWENERVLMRIFPAIAALMMTPLLHAVEWSIEQCSALDLLAGRTGIADVRPSNDPHHNASEMMEQNSGIYRGQWSWQSEMPELLYDIMHSGEATKASPSGFTALHAACVYADENLFYTLLEAGIPVDCRPGDWQQLGYVGDTPLGLLVRFMNSRTAAARVRMAKALIERGANPDAPMTTWKGNRVVTTVPFCELGKQEYNHDMRLLLLQAGKQDLAARTAGWQLNWEWYRDDLVQHMKQRGVARNAMQPQVDAAKKAQIGKIPLLDLIRKGDVEGVRLALDAGASIEVSPRARRYGQEPLFNIPVRKKDDPEAAVEIARMLIEAGSDINALNRRGCSLRIHYDRYYSKASKALCAYLKERGSLIHPDSPMKKEEVAAEEQARLARVEARRRRLAGEEMPEPVQEAVTEPAPVATEAVAQVETTPVESGTQPVVETPVAVTPAEPVVAETPAAEPQPAPEQAQTPEQVAEPAVQPEQVVAVTPEPAVEQPQPVAEQKEERVPAETTEPVAEQPAEQPQPETPSEPVQEEPAAQSEPAPAEEGPKPDSEHMQKLLSEVQAQLAELQAKYEAEQRAKDEAEQQQKAQATENQE